MNLLFFQVINVQTVLKILEVSYNNNHRVFFWCKIIIAFSSICVPSHGKKSIENAPENKEHIKRTKIRVSFFLEFLITVIYARSAAISRI